MAQIIERTSNGKKEAAEKEAVRQAQLQALRDAKKSASTFQHEKLKPSIEADHVVNEDKTTPKGQKGKRKKRRGKRSQSS